MRRLDRDQSGDFVPYTFFRLFQAAKFRFARQPPNAAKAARRSVRVVTPATSTGVRLTHRWAGFGMLTVGVRGATQVRGKDGVHPEMVRKQFVK
jgi:hypothetical protein